MSKIAVIQRQNTPWIYDTEDGQIVQVYDSGCLCTCGTQHNVVRDFGALEVYTLACEHIRAVSEMIRESRVRAVGVSPKKGYPIKVHVERDGDE